MPRIITQSIKHYVHTPATGIASGAALEIALVSTIAKGAAVALASDVEEGTIVQAVYVEYWAKADNPNFTVNAAIFKRPAGVVAPSFAQMANLGSYPNKKNILEFHQGLAPSGDQVIALFRHWIAIPKGKQRMGLGDVVSIKVSFTGSAGDICGFATFKEKS